jgi:hypothetical protein
MSTDNSAIQKNSETANSDVYSVTAKRIDGMFDLETRRKTVRYEISCDTNAPTTSSAGFGSVNFEMLYLPSNAIEADLVPRLPGLPGFYLRYDRATGYDGHIDDVAMNPESLYPQPQSYAPDMYDYPITDFTKGASITGVATKWWISKLESITWFLAGGLVSGLIGALWGLVMPSVAREKL